MLYIALFVLALVGAGAHLLFEKRPRTRTRVLELLLLYQLVLPIGIGSAFAGLYHLFAPDQAARSIGWATGSPFQFENAFGDLGYGILGILCIWMRGRFWDATVIMSSISLIGDGFNHVYELVVNHNHAVNNAGPILYTDIFGPILVFILLLAYHQSKRLSPSSDSAPNPVR